MQAHLGASMIVERRVSSPTTARVPLPDAVRTVLSAIGDDLRHAPRDCFVDRAELVHWLARMARRIDAAAEMAVQVVPPQGSRQRVRSTPLRAATAREVADAVFGVSRPARSTESRTVISRKGRAVRVEIRNRHDVPEQIRMEI